VHLAMQLLCTYWSIRVRLINRGQRRREMLIRRKIAQVADGFTPFVEWRN
jgi:hypothetical protein